MKVFQIILYLHIAGGSVGLLSGTFVLFARKGTALHRGIGRIYFAGMLTAALSALILSIMHPNYFLFIVGVFSGYLVMTGWRYIRYRFKKTFTKTDWLISSVMALFGTAFIAFGSWLLFNGGSFGAIMIVFGIISLLMVYQDARNYQGHSSIKNFWLTTHLQRMVGGYIASATAFLVVNNTLLSAVVAWLLPTALLTPLIFVWTNKYRAKRALSKTDTV